MTDLTEQLNKGELPEGWYYLKVNEELANYPVIAECVLISQFSYFYDFDEAKIEQVLAPVPSYEEWQASEKHNKNLEAEIKEKETQRIELMTRLNDVNNENHALEIENTKLKELLKECRRQFEEVALYRYDVADDDQEDWFKISTEQAGIANKMITKISQALGEDK